MFGRQWDGHHVQHHAGEVSIMRCDGLGSC